MNSPEEIRILEHFTNILDKLSVAYAIGGSIASSIYGKVRFTEDADVTVESFEDRMEKLYELVKSEYYISRDAMYQALKQHGSFNIIHIKSAFKIDVFIQKDTAFEKQLISRRRALHLSDAIKKAFSVVSPEDIILLKLKWYHDSGFISERQWNDVLGILTVQMDKLDFEYLKEYAGILGINELLEKAKTDTIKS